MKPANTLMLLLLASLIFTSCIDSKYDLDNIDMTVGSKVNLTLPSSSTGIVRLKNLLNLSEDGTIQVVEATDGSKVYTFRKKGNADISPIKIETITVDRPNINDYDGNVNLRELMAVRQQSGAKKPSSKTKASLARKQEGGHKNSMQIEVEGQKVDVSYEDYFYYDISSNDAHHTIDVSESDSITENVVSIEKVRVNDVTLVVKITLDDVPEWMPMVWLQNFEVHMPAGVHVKSCKLCGLDAEEIGAEYVKLPQKVKMVRTSAGYEADIELVVDMLEEGGLFRFDGEKHKAYVSGEIDVHGTVCVDTSNLTEYTSELSAYVNALSAEEKAEFLAEPTIRYVMPEQVHYVLSGEVTNDIELTHVTGRVRYKIDEIDPIEIKDLPNFMNRDNMVLDLSSPMLMLTLNNSLPVDFNTSLQFTTDVVSETGHRTIESHTAEMPVKEGENVYCFAQDEARAKYYMPEEYRQSVFVKTTNLSEILSVIPDEVNVDVGTIEAEIEDLDVRKEFPVALDYELVAPIDLGPRFNLIYEGTEDGFNLGDTFKDVTLSADARVEVTAKAYSDLPARIVVGAVPISVNNLELAELEGNSVALAARAKGVPIRLVFAAKSGHLLSEYLQPGPRQIDGIHYEAVVDDAVEGNALTEENNICLKEVKVRIVGEVTYNANSDK